MKRTTFAPLALLAALALPCAAADDADPSARHWTQARGNAGRTGGAAVEPLRADPVEAWRQALPGPALCEPVTWGGVVFVAAQKDKGRKLLAFRATNGDALGERDLGSGGRVALATWQSVVLALEPNQVRAFPHQGTKFGSGWSARGSFSAPPCIWRGFVFVCEGTDILVLDATRGTKVARAPAASATALANLDETKGSKTPPTGGAVGVYRSPGDDVLYCVNVATLGDVALLSRTRVDDLGPKTQLRYTTTEVLGTLSAAADESDRWSMLPCRIEGDDGGPGAWIVLAPRGFKDGSAGRFVPDAAKASSLGLVTAPAVLQRTAYAFNGRGDLQSWRANGKTETLVDGAKAPVGTKPGPGTRAGGVAYLGNLALDVAEGRVMWTLKEDLVTPIVPAGDRRAVFATGDALVCVSDAAGAAEAAAPAPAKGHAGAGADPVTIPLPGDADGVLLADGRHLAGDFSLKDGRVTVTPATGDPVEFGLDEVVVAQKGGAAEVRGDDAAAAKVWRGAVRGAWCDALEAVFQEYAKGSLLDDARRVLARLRAAGASEKRLQRLDAMLNGKSPRSDAVRAKKLAAQEDAARDAAVEGFLNGVSWCSERGFATAATVLLADVAKIRGGADSDVEARAKRLVPAGFPWKDAPDAWQQWMTWAEALLPSGGTFFETDDAAWGRLTNEPWVSRRPLGFRTRNMILFCMDKDVAVCGRSLLLGEGTIRALQVFLGQEDAPPARSDAERLEVRIHANKKSYLEEPARGGKTPEWSGGYYSPAENVSRFFVDRGEKGNGPPDLRELGRVLTHELTHHYVEFRWMQGRGGGGGAGYWVIEGIATFVENQAVQMERRGLAFDDRTVPNLDAMSTVAKQANTLFKAEKFVDMSHGDFDGLNDAFLMRVKLRNSTEEKGYTQRGLWYDQAGALTFFFLHERGEEGRRRFVDYMRAHYTGVAPRSGWLALGYDSAEELDKDFSAFLAKLRGG